MTYYDNILQNICSTRYIVHSTHLYDLFNKTRPYDQVIVTILGRCYALISYQRLKYTRYFLFKIISWIKKSLLREKSNWENFAKNFVFQQKGIYMLSCYICGDSPKVPPFFQVSFQFWGNGRITVLGQGGFLIGWAYQTL